MYNITKKDFENHVFSAQYQVFLAVDLHSCWTVALKESSHFSGPLSFEIYL